MANHYLLDERPKDIKSKRTARGFMNPRLVAAQNGHRERLKNLKELSHTFRHLTKKEISAIYTPERLAELFKRCDDNMKDLFGPSLNREAVQ